MSTNASASASAQGTPAQKFHRGDLVTCNEPRYSGEALILGSYADQFHNYSPASRQSYTLLFTEDGNEVSWFYDSQLELIQHAGEVGEIAIETARNKREQLRTERSNLEWIVANWPAHNFDSLQALATECGLGSLWGSSGEGITAYERMRAIAAAFSPSMQEGIEAVRAKIERVKSGGRDFPWPDYRFGG